MYVRTYTQTTHSGNDLGLSCESQTQNTPGTWPSVQVCHYRWPIIGRESAISPLCDKGVQICVCRALLMIKELCSKHRLVGNSGPASDLEDRIRTKAIKGCSTLSSWPSGLPIGTYVMTQLISSHGDHITSVVRGIALTAFLRPTIHKRQPDPACLLERAGPAGRTNWLHSHLHRHHLHHR